MTGSVDIRIEGMEALFKRFEGLEGLKKLRPVIKAAALHVKGAVAQYPPATDANKPKTVWVSGGPNSWYQRGRGPLWLVKSGETHSAKTSETLGRRWTIAEVNGGMGARIGNNASYGPYVQDEDEQAAFHKARGWKTIQQVSEEEADTVTNFIRREVEKILEGSE